MTKLESVIIGTVPREPIAFVARNLRQRERRLEGQRRPRHFCDRGVPHFPTLPRRQFPYNWNLAGYGNGPCSHEMSLWAYNAGIQRFRDNEISGPRASRFRDSNAPIFRDSDMRGFRDFDISISRPVCLVFRDFASSRMRRCMFSRF